MGQCGGSSKAVIAADARAAAVRTQAGAARPQEGLPTLCLSSGPKGAKCAAKLHQQSAIKEDPKMMKRRRTVTFKDPAEIESVDSHAEDEEHERAFIRARISDRKATGYAVTDERLRAVLAEAEAAASPGGASPAAPFRAEQDGDRKLTIEGDDSTRFTAAACGEYWCADRTS
jgi:hypothetical protein